MELGPLSQVLRGIPGIISYEEQVDEAAGPVHHLDVSPPNLPLASVAGSVMGPLPGQLLEQPFAPPALPGKVGVHGALEPP